MVRFICLIERIGLLFSRSIQRGVNTASLYHPIFVVLGLAMTDDQKFLAIQMPSVYLSKVANLNLSMFSPEIKVEQLNAFSKGSMVENLGPWRPHTSP